MADVLLEDLLDRIRPECASCPYEQMVQVLRDVIRDFCQHTRAYIFEVETESIFALISDYDIEIPSLYVMPVAVEFLSVNGSESKFRETAWLDSNISNWRLRRADDFRYYTQIQPRVITFPCVPTINGTPGGLAYRVSMKPLPDADRVDQTLADEWIECWSDGTKARLKLMTGKPWADAARGAQLDAVYRQARGRARIRAQRGYGNPQQGWVGPKFAGR